MQSIQNHLCLPQTNRGSTPLASKLLGMSYLSQQPPKTNNKTNNISITFRPFPGLCEAYRIRVGMTFPFLKWG
jgi:hypothetical protein